MSLVKEQNSFLRDVALLILKAQDLGFEVTGGELCRPKELQLVYYNGKKVIEKDNEVYLTNAPIRSTTMNTKHLIRKAIDLNFFKDGVYINDLRMHEAKKILQPIGDYWESLNKKNKWGGNWKTFFDSPHFQRNNY